MKKLLLLCLVLLGGVMQMSANGEIYLRNNISTNWSTDDPNFKSEKTWDATNSQDVYEFTINASTLGTKDFYFRINRYDSDGKLIGPYNHNDYKFSFDNGQNETYTAPRIDKFQGDNGAFCIEHSKIKANQYKITIYLKYSDEATVDDTKYTNIWVYYIKVEIVDMPVTISSVGKATFSSNRALNFNGISNINAYMITNASAGTLTLSDAMTKVPANTGLYLEGAEGTYNIPVITTDDASGVSTSDNMLKPGTGSAVAATEEDGAITNFILTNKTTTNANAPLKFYKVNGNTVPVGKAYLQIPTANVGSRDFFWFDNEATEIKTIENGQRSIDANAPMYNLAGQRVSKNYKGVVIQNGKKMLMK